HERRIAAAKEGGKKKTTPKADKPIKPAQAEPATAKQRKSKPVKEKSTKPNPLQKDNKGKLIIYYLGRHHNIHQRSGSPLNLAEDDLSLGNLKFVPKGKIDEVFGMKLLEEWIIENIRNAPYYNAYLEMIAKHERRIAAAKEGGKKKTTPKADKPMKPAQAEPATAKQRKSKPVKEKSTKPNPLQKDNK
nr:histone deacetylase 14 [Tanacetum cinerariifolium]